MSDSHIEVHIYSMVDMDDDTSTLAKHHQEPDYYDVSVLKYYHEGGEIETIEEFENITDTDKATAKYDEMCKKYPDADHCEIEAS